MPMHQTSPLFRKNLCVRSFWLVTALAASPASGQTFLPDPVEQPVFGIELEKPFLPDADALDSYSSILESDLVVPWRPGVSLQIGLPLALAGADFVDGTSVYVGNLRASLLFGEAGALRSFVGISLPTASNISGPDLAVLVAAVPSLDTPETWIEDGFSVSGAVLPSTMWSGGGKLGFRFGGAALVPTDLENLFVFVRPAAWARFPLERAELRVDLTTSYDLTGDDGFGQQFSAYVGLGAQLSDVSGRPGLFIRLPLDADAREVLDLSIGFSAEL